ncbi:MAG: trigger factor [Spirochaetota bacterium]
MEVTEKKLENASAMLQITVPQEEIAEQFEKQYQIIQKNAKVDGFRKGKVPMDIIRTRFKSNAEPDVIEALIRDNYLKALEKLDIRPIDHPKCDFESFDQDTPFTFTAIVDLYPEVTLGEYTSIPVEEAKVTVSDADIMREIEAIREKHATLEVREEGVVQKGDQVTLSVSRLNQDGEKEDPNQMNVIAGQSDKPYEFDIHVVGMEKGGVKEIDITYPKDYSTKQLAGETVPYVVVVDEISIRHLPPLDDEFAKDLGKYETLDQLKQKTRNDIEKYVEQRTRGNAKTEILQKIIDKSAYEIPNSLIQREKESIFNRMKQRFNIPSIDDPGVFAALMGMDKDGFDNKLAEEARQSIKTTLTLSEIAKKEELAVTDEEYDARLAEIASQYQKSVEEIRDLFQKNGAVDNVKSDMLFDKAMDFLYDNAKVKKGKTKSLEDFMKQ